MTTRTKRAGDAAPKLIQTALREQVDRLGVLSTSRLYGVSPAAIARIVAGLPVRRGTVQLARSWLEQMRLQEARLRQVEELALGQEGGEP